MESDLFQGQKPELKAGWACPAYLNPSPERREDMDGPAPNKGVFRLKCVFAPISGFFKP